jgi:hypothetical protein
MSYEHWHVYQHVYMHAEKSQRRALCMHTRYMQQAAGQQRPSAPVCLPLASQRGGKGLVTPFVTPSSAPAALCHTPARADGTAAAVMQTVQHP